MVSLPITIGQVAGNNDDTCSDNAAGHIISHTIARGNREFIAGNSEQDEKGKKSMEEFDCAIIGAGIVGLAAAYELSKRFKNIVLLEQFGSFGRMTSSRSSEVIHAGIYYKKNSLKARLCVEGRHLLYDFLDTYDIPYKKIGKLLIAAGSNDECRLAELFGKGRDNGVDDLVFMRPKKISDIEPTIVSLSALWSPSTGIVDTHRLMKKLHDLASDAGVLCAFNSEVREIAKTGNGYELSVFSPDGETMRIRAQVVINSAGLFADRVSSMAGIDAEQNGYRLSFLKGEYFSVNHLPSSYMKVLVYPPPEDSSLGIHTVLDLGGRLRLGPNACPAESIGSAGSIDYSVAQEHIDEFFSAASRFLPFLKKESLAPDTSGIRPKITPPEGRYPDFIIRDESDKGFPGFINLIGMESPGITSSLAIARHVSSIVFGSTVF